MHYSNNNYHPNVIFRNITATVAGCMSMNIQRYLHIFDGHCLLQLRNINFIIKIFIIFEISIDEICHLFLRPFILIFM